MEISGKKNYYPKSQPIMIPKKNVKLPVTSVTSVTSITSKSYENNYMRHASLTPTIKIRICVSCENHLTTNLFDPSKTSPPNSWNSRLMARICTTRVGS